MGNLVFQATLGGQVNLVGPNTASTYNINVPAVAGTMVTTGDTGTVSSTMLASSLSLTTPNIGVATGTSLKVSAGFYSTSSSSFTYTDGIVMDYTTGLGRISVGTADGLAFYNGGVATTELMRLDSSGNLGVGTNSPLSKVHAYDSTYRQLRAQGTGGYITVGHGSGSAVIDTSTYLVLSTSDTERARLDSAGNLGLGVTPSAWISGNKVLDIGTRTSLWSGGAGQPNLGYNCYVNSGGSFIYKATAAANYYTQDGTHAWFNAASGTAGNPISFTQAMTLDASGNLVVGSTSTNGRINSYISGNGNYFYMNDGTESWKLASTGTGLLTIGSGSVANTMTFDRSGNVGIGNSSGISRLQVYGTNAANLAIANFRQDGASANIIEGAVAAGALRFVVAVTGNVTNTNNSYGGISDVKLKENITDATPKLNGLMQVRVVNYNLIGDENKQLGVIAQELEQVFPLMVDEAIDRDEEGNELGTTTKSVKYSVFVPMLIKAIQEQQAIIQQLQADVAALKAPQ